MKHNKVYPRPEKAQEYFVTDLQILLEKNKLTFVGLKKLFENMFKEYLFQNLPEVFVENKMLEKNKMK